MSLSFLCMMVGFRQTAGSEANEGQCNYVSGSADRAVSESDSWLPESMTHMRDLEGGGLLYTSVREKSYDLAFTKRTICGSILFRC